MLDAYTLTKVSHLFRHHLYICRLLNKNIQIHLHEQAMYGDPTDIRLRVLLRRRL